MTGVLTICAATAGPAPAAGLEDGLAIVEAHQRQAVMMTTRNAIMPQMRKQATVGDVSVGRPGTTRDTGE